MNESYHEIDVVQCPQCGEKEYYGKLHWRDGQKYCRRCIEKLWVKEGSWPKGEVAFENYFPFYEYGIDYTKEEADE